VSTIDEVLGTRRIGNNQLTFHIPKTLHGAFGGAFGGMLAAACLQAARSVAPGRRPTALDCRFVRGLREPDAVATVTVLHEGRSLSNVSVDLVDADGRLCTRAMVSLVDAGVLHPLDRPGPKPGDWKPHAAATKWPAVAPIVEAIDSRFVGEEGRTYAIAVLVPWDEEGHSAEAACVAADMAVGAPASSAVGHEKASSPNPDLSLRFFGDVTTKDVIGVGRLERAVNGVAAIGLEAWSDGQLVATGISTALLLPT
jgi:acyl-coenzyme A thioesterase PaaI-like protein